MPRVLPDLLHGVGCTDLVVLRAAEEVRWPELTNRGDGMSKYSMVLFWVLICTLASSSSATAEAPENAVAMTYVVPGEQGSEGCDGYASPLQSVAVDLSVGALSDPIQTLEIDLGFELLTEGRLVFDHLELPVAFIGIAEWVDDVLRITLSAADGCYEIAAAEHVARIVFAGDLGWQRIYLGDWAPTGVPRLSAMSCAGESSSLDMSQCTEININDPHVPAAVHSFGVLKARF